MEYLRRISGFAGPYFDELGDIGVPYREACGDLGWAFGMMFRRIRGDGLYDLQ